MPRRQAEVRGPEGAAAQDASEFDLGPIREIIAATPDPSGGLIAVLQRVQHVYGYLPEPVVREIARLSEVPASRIYGVVTFYAQFTTVPSGRHKVCVCQGTACHVRGGQGVLRAVESKLGIKAGTTSDDMEHTLETAACLGACSLAPVMTVDSQYFGKLTGVRVAAALEQIGSDGGESDDD